MLTFLIPSTALVEKTRREPENFMELEEPTFELAGNSEFIPNQQHPMHLFTNKAPSIPSSRKSSFSFSVSRRSSASMFFKRGDPYKKYAASINDYELLEIICGVDDVSFLYLAKHKQSGDVVALKYTDLSLSPDSEFIEELIKTTHNTGMLRHPNILPYFTTFVENDRLWTVTLPMRSGSCRMLMKNRYNHGFSETVVATILKEVLKAIQYLHFNYLIHNDIRADNILIDSSGEVRITGFRQMISLQRDGKVRSSVFSSVGDKIEWAAPEVMAQNSNYCEKVDIYSFGITALELAFNQTPFDSYPPLKILLSKLNYDCPAVDTNGKIFSSTFYQVVMACLQKDPKKRPDVSELMDHAFFRIAKNAQYLVDAHVVSS